MSKKHPVRPLKKKMQAVDNQEKKFPKTDIRYWKERLLLRRYHFPGSGATEQDFAAWIDCDETGHFFPLGASDVDAAAAKALKIYQTIAGQGWEKTNQLFSRELLVGFEWCANPIMWTYTTIHTIVGKRPSVPPAKNTDDKRILIVESDAGIRQALAWCINQQPGFCSFICDSAISFERAFNQCKPWLVLINRNLIERVGLVPTGELAAMRPDVPALMYSTFVDGNQLFVSPPGGVVGFMFKRVKPDRLFEPLLNAAGRTDAFGKDLLSGVRSYFKELLQTRSGENISGLGQLTPREREVLGLMSKGCVDKEIAQAMSISVWTVHGHIKKIFERLRVRTRTEAAVRYLEK